MAPKTKPDAAATPAAETPNDDPQLPRAPQGITLRLMNTGDEKRDTITKFKRPRIDPACLVVDGQAPFLALPIHGSRELRIRQVTAETAADMLSCDPASGGSSIHRLATDREVEAYKAEAAKRAKK